MLETIHKFSEIYFTIVKVEKSLIVGLFTDRMTEIDTISVFFDGRRFDYDITRQAQVGEEVENLRRI